jgi:stage III sporulation protein SpoIIIAA
MTAVLKLAPAASQMINEAEDLRRLLAFFPKAIRVQVEPDMGRIEEIKIRYGRKLWVLLDGKYVPYDYDIELADMSFLISKLGTFRDDNRRGIDGTGHRITRVMGSDGTEEGSPVGFTFRVGRYFDGMAEPLRPFIVESPSMLIVGEAGSGKTTLLRGTAKMSAEYFPMQAVIVDTSGDVAGDGKVPHIGIGDVDVMPVRSKAMQAALIEEAVKNQNVRVLIVDEINRLAEAEMIAGGMKAGARLMGTTHGRNISRVLENKNLAPLFYPEPVFSWFAVIERRGEVVMYRASEVMEAVAAGKDPQGEVVLLNRR